jgi:hypothetical protein
MSISAFAQNQKVIDNAPDNYLNALKSSNEGAIESAIFLAVKYHIFYPENIIEKVKKEIEKLAQNGKSDRIRYKAYLAVQLFGSANLKSKIKKADYKDSNQFLQWSATS